MIEALVLACGCAAAGGVIAQQPPMAEQEGVCAAPAPEFCGTAHTGGDALAPTAQESLSNPGRANREESTAAETGLASWYGPGFHRRKTASGERFDMFAMTAAHRTLAFGTLICVRSQVTGRTVVVRVNDRGPRAQNRVVDLSRAAAIELGLHGLGLKPVEVLPLTGGDTSCPPE